MKKVGRLWNKTPFKNRIAPPLRRRHARQRKNLLAAAHLRAGDIFVVGCSSSEIVGGHIGKDSSMEAAAAVLAGILPVLKAQGVYLAAQCCEHLNRAIVIEQEAAEKVWL